MKKTILVTFIILLLIGISFASLTCTGDTTPNLKMDLYLNCTNEVESTCWALVSNPNSVGSVGYYPTTAFGEDRIRWNTMSDGKFVANIFLDDSHFAPATSYTAQIYCVGSDNSSSSFEFDFSTITYKSPDQLTAGVLWVQQNVAYIFGFIIGVAVILVILRLIGWI